MPENLPELLASDELWLRQLGDFLHEWWADKREITFQTSGSTGKPKVVRFTKAQCRESARRTLKYFSISTGTTALLALPTNYVAGKMMVVRAMIGNLNLVAVSPKMNPWDDTLPEIDFAAVTPQQLSAPGALEQMTRTMNPKGILLVGGAPIPEAIRQGIRDCNIPVYETYGMTETLTHVAVRRVSYPPESLFSALPEITFAVDSRNCLVISAPYLGQDPIHTRDVVRLVGGDRFQWRGRRDRVINSGGIKIQPEEVEARIGKALTDRAFFIYPLPDERLGEKVVLWVEGEDRSGLKEQIDYVLNSFSGPEKPREYYLLPRFQRTATGKIDRHRTVERWKRMNNMVDFNRGFTIR